MLQQYLGDRPEAVASWFEEPVRDVDRPARDVRNLASRGRGSIALWRNVAKSPPSPGRWQRRAGKQIRYRNTGPLRTSNFHNCSEVPPSRLLSRIRAAGSLRR